MSERLQSLGELATRIRQPSHVEKATSSIWESLQRLETAYKTTDTYPILRNAGLSPERAMSLSNYLREHRGPAGLIAIAIDRINLLAQQERMTRRLGLPPWTSEQVIRDSIDRIQVELIQEEIKGKV